MCRYKLRTLVGEREPPVSLAEAAAKTGRHYITLAKAAERGALPTIAAGDRRLFYLATIAEAEARWHIRPRSRRHPRRQQGKRSEDDQQRED